MALVRDKDAERRFTVALRAMAERAKVEVNYNPTRFFEMLATSGGFATASNLLATPQPADGFVSMVLAGRIDLTLETVVQQDEWRGYFSDEELRTARRRTR